MENPTHTVEILTGTQESSDYPYGSLRCHITFRVEFTKKRGFRFVTQTTNPKNGRVNAPKKGIYHDFIVLHREPDTGHVKPLHFSIKGYSDVERLAAFLDANPSIVFTADESAYLWASVIVCLQANAKYTEWAPDATKEQIGEALRFSAFVSAYKGKADFHAIRGIGFKASDVRALDSRARRDAERIAAQGS